MLEGDTLVVCMVALLGFSEGLVHVILVGVKEDRLR